MEENRYSKACYLMLKKLDDAGRITWASSVKNLLFRYGFGIVWFEQQIGDPGTFLLNFTQRIKDCYRQEWHYGLNNSPRLEVYCTFKSLLEPEKYLSFLSYRKKKVLADFRCSTRKLNVELGRHFNVPRHERVCMYCKTVRNHVVVDRLGISVPHFIYKLDDCMNNVRLCIE